MLALKKRRKFLVEITAKNGLSYKRELVEFLLESAIKRSKLLARPLLVDSPEGLKIVVWDLKFSEKWIV
jgi:hypothetical protein